MSRLRIPATAIAVVAALAGCDGRDPVANNAAASGNLPPPSSENSPNPQPLPPANQALPAEVKNEPDPAAKIPAALQGRWGLSPDDCTSTRGDAKGLLTISGGELRFYESRAVPGSDIQADADSISGNFSFTGEGQTWSKYQSLQLQNRQLVRTETNPTASYTYAKCQ